MEIIYLDLHFLLNLLTDYLILLCSAVVCSLRLKRLRYLLSALVGAAYSVLTLFPAAHILSTGASKLICSVLMGIIAFGS
ncbi:MAG: sigma-E processing peptidase SpoIIGA, partial [Oscillospiraceae bacterium]|nr:sigma-E processing peptidase SpoIIGA [Oscillospiraceae bacterium]